jgi:hypothetical protein
VLVLPGTRCPEHTELAKRSEQRRELERGGSAARGYDAAWRRFRKWFLAQLAHMVCEDCGKRPSVHVHHKKKVQDFPELRLRESNCRGLCAGCHAIRTLRGE